MFGDKVMFDMTMECDSPYIGTVHQRDTFFEAKKLRFNEVLSTIDDIKPCVDMDDANIGEIFMAMYRAIHDVNSEDYSTKALEPFCVSYSFLPLESPNAERAERRHKVANLFGIDNYISFSTLTMTFTPVVYGDEKQ